MTELLSAAFAVFFVLGLCVFAAATEPDRSRRPHFDLTQESPSLYHERQAVSPAQSKRNPATETKHPKRRSPLHSLQHSPAHHS